MTRRIGIYGGSFNPIHNGHTLLGAALCDMGYVDELWFVVSPMNPLKQDVQSELLPDAERLRLCRLAVVDDPRLLVSDVEFSMPRPSYMADTLALLRNIHSDKEFILVIGSDNWDVRQKWKDFDKIEGMCRKIVVIGRGEEKENGFSLPDISSTMIKKMIKDNQDPDVFLPAGILDYIRKNGLYA